MKDGRVSAAIVTYHSGEQTLEALRCLTDSTLAPDVFLVDNAPGDGLAARVQAQFPAVQVLSQPENLGFGRGNNAVLPLLKSDYHLLVNPDVTFPPDLIARMTAWMDAHPECLVLTPRVLNEDGTVQHLPLRQPTVRYLLGGKLERLGGCFRRWRQEYTRSAEPLTEPTPVAFATGCFQMIRTQTFRELQGFDPRFFLYQEDSDLARRVLEKGQIVFHPDMQVTHAWARENTRTLRGMRRQVSSILKFYRKWGWRW